MNLKYGRIARRMTGSGQVMRSPVSPPLRHHDGGRAMKLSFMFGSQHNDRQRTWPVVAVSESSL